MKLKRRRLLALGEAIAAVGNLKGIKFAYAIAKNGKKVVEELEDMSAGLKPSKRFREYDKKRIALCEKHGKKDENGNAIQVPVLGGQPNATRYVGLGDDNEEFQKDLKKLRKEYQSELDEREELQEKYDDILDEELEIKFHMIKLSDVPKDITSGQFRGIIDLVEDGEIEGDTAPQKE